MKSPKWASPEPDELAGYFTEDAVYHNIPMEPVKGRDAIKEFMGEDYSVSHVPLEARAVLNSFDDRAAHYEVIDRREQ